MKKIKRLITFVSVLFIICILFMLAGCGSGDGNKNKDNDSEERSLYPEITNIKGNGSDGSHFVD